MQAIYLNAVEYIKRQGIAIVALCVMAFSFWTLRQNDRAEMLAEIAEVRKEAAKCNDRYIVHLEGDCVKMTNALSECDCFQDEAPKNHR